MLTGPGWSSEWIRDQVGTVRNLRTLALFKAGLTLLFTYRLLPRGNADWCHQMVWFSREARIHIFILNKSNFKILPSHSNIGGGEKTILVPN